MPKIVFFDFDGTITTDDSLIKFIRYVVGDTKTIWGMPMLFHYKLKLILNYRAKQMMLSYFFKGKREEYSQKVAQEYATLHCQDLKNNKNNFLLEKFVDDKPDFTDFSIPFEVNDKENVSFVVSFINDGGRKKPKEDRNIYLKSIILQKN